MKKNMCHILCAAMSSRLHTNDSFILTSARTQLEPWFCCGSVEIEQSVNRENKVDVEVTREMYKLPLCDRRYFSC